MRFVPFWLLMLCLFSHEEYHVQDIIDILDIKMKKIEQEKHYVRPIRKDNADFRKYPELVKGVRYDALNSYLHHIVFAILMRERQAKSGSMYIT